MSDPREFALQLAVVAERLDERSVRAVERMEAACARLERDVGSAAAALAGERMRFAAGEQAASTARLRLTWMALAALVLAALVVVAGCAFAVAAARAELASLDRDAALVRAINAADVTVCGERLCARVDGSRGEPLAEYQPIAPRQPSRTIARPDRR